MEKIQKVKFKNLSKVENTITKEILGKTTEIVKDIKEDVEIMVDDNQDIIKTINQIKNNIAHLLKMDSSEIDLNDQSIIGSAIAKLAVLCSTDKPIKATDHGTPPTDPELEIYKKIMDLTIRKYPLNDQNNPNCKVAENDASYGYNNGAYASCAQAAAAIIRAIIDPDFESAGPDSQLKYLQNNKDKWAEVGKVEIGERLDDKCQPGDLLMEIETNSKGEIIKVSHVMIYVGNESNTGNVFEAKYTEKTYPNIAQYDKAEKTYMIYRPNGNNINNTYPAINLEETI